MSVFNSFTGCQSAPARNLSEYYSTVGEYVKSTLPQYSKEQNCQKRCVTSSNEVNVQPQSSFNCNFNSQCRGERVPACVTSARVPEYRLIYQNTPNLRNSSFVHQNKYKYAQMYRHSYHTKKPSFNINMKKKRKRTIFTTEQIIALEAVFQKKPYISREERVVLMQKLQVGEKSIKIWFQNRRRLTDKRVKDYVSDSTSSDESSETIDERLTHIESQIKRNTDQYGYVTLDDQVMGDLCKIIDEYLSQDPGSWDRSSVCNQQTVVLKDENSKSIVMYEPISPVSLSEALENI